MQKSKIDFHRAMSSEVEMLKASVLLHFLHKILLQHLGLFFQGKCLEPNAALSKAADQVLLSYSQNRVA